MAVKTKLRSLSPEEFLEGEQISKVRHELVAGQAYAMVGASNIHNLLAGSVYGILRAHLKKPCQVFMSDMKVRVGDDFYYPDVVVSCTPTNGVYYFVSDPVVIVEILSPSTERQDRLEKRLAYQKLHTLREYVLINQDKMRMEIYRRVSDGWELEQIDERDELRLEAVGLAMPVADIYQDVMTGS